MTLSFASLLREAVPYLARHMARHIDDIGEGFVLHVSKAARSTSSQIDDVLKGLEVHIPSNILEPSRSARAAYRPINPWKAKACVSVEPIRITGFEKCKHLEVGLGESALFSSVLLGLSLLAIVLGERSPKKRTTP